MYGQSRDESISQRNWRKKPDKISYQPRMTGIFKSRRLEMGVLMKHLGFVLILLLLGIGFIGNSAMATLTASQHVPSPVGVGETVMVTVMLTYNGANSTQAVITPLLPPGVASEMPGGQTAELYPMASAPISYPIRADQSGTYVIVSQVEYAEDGTWRNLRLEAPFAVIGEMRPEPQPFPGDRIPGEVAPPGGNPPGDMPPGGNPPGNMSPGDMPPGNVPPGGEMPPAPDIPAPGDNQSSSA
jgi:hypothetical protein